MTVNYSLKHLCLFTLTLCSPFSKRDSISESLLSVCTLYTVQQRCCNKPIMYSFSICSCILNSLKVAHSDWRNERKSLLLEKLVFDSCKKKPKKKQQGLDFESFIIKCNDTLLLLWNPGEQYCLTIGQNASCVTQQLSYDTGRTLKTANSTTVTQLTLAHPSCNINELI